MKKYLKKEYIIAHLLKIGHISSWEAFNKYQHTRLSAMIYDLRQAGAAIKTVEEHHCCLSHARYIVIDRETVINTLAPKMRKNVEFLMKAANDPEY
jgi:hypothetical protein